MSKSEVVSHIKKKIADFTPNPETREIGTVVTVRDGIAEIAGLQDCMASEMLSFNNGAVMGVALNLNEDTIGAIILGDITSVKQGDVVTRTKEILSISVHNDILGRVVDAFAKPIDGKGDLPKGEERPIERIAPGVMTRKPVTVPVQTGIKAIDALVPIGRGQRELIIGDRQTGKTAVAIDTILSQKGQNMICVYVSIGQKDSRLRTIQTRLEEDGAMEYTVIVSAGATDPASMNYLAPYTGTAVAEHFLEQGKDVLVIYDDLSKHASSYREISLLLRRPPGREAYPGDVFYLHSRLLERACRLNEENGGGSITALPIIETKAGDISAYIPTNVISITDGQIFLESDLFNKGIRPAVNVGSSVSRVGSSAQIKAMKKVAGTLKLDLAQYRELEAFAQFGSDLDESTKKQLNRGRRGTELLKQSQFSPLEVQNQVIVLYALTRGFLDTIALEDIGKAESSIIETIPATAPTFMKEVAEKGKWSDEGETELKKAMSDWLETFKAQEAN